MARECGRRRATVDDEGLGSLTPNDRWSGWWQPQCWPLVVPLSAVVVVVEALAVWTGVSWRTPGGVGVTPVLPAAALLATLVGWPGLGFSHRQLRAWGECAATTLLLLIVVSIVFLARVGPPRALLSFIAGATEEELVFRLAAPLAAGGVAAWAWRRSPVDLLTWGTGPRVVALTVAAATFTVGPGHLAAGGNRGLASPAVRHGRAVAQLRRPAHRQSRRRAARPRAVEPRDGLLPQWQHPASGVGVGRDPGARRLRRGAERAGRRLGLVGVASPMPLAA